MYKVKQFMNKITDKGTADPSTGSVQTLDTDGDGQVSAEGFLCPDCMTAFPNPETLAEHYTTKHTDAPSSETTSELDDNALYNLALEHDELLELRAALETERQQSLDMQRELVTLRKESTSRKASVASSRSHNDEAENMLREECTNLRKQTDEWKSNFNKVNSEMETLKETTTDRIQILNESLKTLKEELSHIQNKAALSEGECRDLRLEAQRLREQHSELVSRVEGDEGTQAAIESLAKERDTLTLNLDTTQVQNRELSKNLYNIGLELEKLRNEHALITSQFNEYKKKAEAAAAEQTKELAEKVTLLETDRKTIDESRTSIKLLEKQLKEQSSKLNEQKTKMVHSDELIANLEKTAASRDQEINQLNLLVESLRKEMRSAEEKSIVAEKTIDEFQNAIQTKVEKIKILETENSSLRTANENVQSVLTKQKEVFTNHLTDVNAFLGITESEYDTNQSGIETYKQRSNLVLTGMADKINGIKQIQQSVQRQLDAMNQELGSSKAEIEILADRNKKLTEEMKSQKETNAAEFESLQKELIENRTSFEHKLKSAKKFEEQVAKLEEEMTVVRNDSKRFQDERDNLQAERLELDKKYKSSEEARTLLLDRCLAGESETEKFNETIQGLQRKLADALAALQELGRENQSLQVESAKLQGRKWTDDSNVNNCSTCSKEFSITVRKHHCRVCGNIFCHECSSKTASIPSSKKPVRVCDACADELLK